MLTPQANFVNSSIGLDYIADEMPATVALCLYKSTFTPGPATTLADFIANEVNFTGYARVAMAGTWSNGFDDDGQVIEEYSPGEDFTQTATTDSDTAGGWWIATSVMAPVNFVAHGAFDSSFQFNKVGNSMHVKPRLQFTNNSDAAIDTLVGP